MSLQFASITEPFALYVLPNNSWKKNRNGNHIFSWLFESNHTLNISEYLTEYEEDKQEVLFCLFDPNLVMSCSC